MKLIDRYVGGQMMVTFLLSVGVLSFVLILGKIFKELLELLVKNDTPLELILSILAYILPFSLAFTIPWGFLTSVLLVFGKMSGEHELIAFRASGVSVPRLCYSVLGLGILCVGVCVWINIDVAPRAHLKMKEALFNIATNNPMAMFGADRVIESFPNKKIYVESSKGPELSNLLVYEVNEENLLMKVIFAHRGLIETDHEKKELLLHVFDAAYESRDDHDAENLLKIKQGITMQEATYVIPLEELHDKKKSNSISGLTSGELLDRLNAEEKLKTMQPKERIEEETATRTEISRRYAFSLASLALGLVGVPLAITAHRKETSIGLLLSLCVAISYFFFIIMAGKVREKPEWHPELLMWLPNILCLVFGGWLFLRMARR